MDVLLKPASLDCISLSHWHLKQHASINTAPCFVLTQSWITAGGLSNSDRIRYHSVFRMLMCPSDQNLTQSLILYHSVA